MSASPSDLKQEIEHLKTSIDILTGIYAEEVDIHTHTRQIGPYYQQFCAVDRRYNLSSNTQPLENVIRDILRRCPASHLANVTRVLNTIRVTVGSDHETHVNLQELLMRTWSLVNKPNNHSNAFELFIQNLDHNIITGGGCVPGIAARLIQPYTHFVFKMLSNLQAQTSTVTPSVPSVSIPARRIQPSPIPQSHRVHDAEDRELQEALRLSMCVVHERKMKQEQEDSQIAEELQLAEVLRISAPRS